MTKQEPTYKVQAKRGRAKWSDVKDVGPASHEACAAWITKAEKINNSVKIVDPSGKELSTPKTSYRIIPSN